MTSRRDFAKAMAALGLSTPFVQHGRAFLAEHDTVRLTRLGVQLYTLRDAARADIAATVARIRSIGYREIEWWGEFGKTPAQIRAMLDAHGLTSPSAHVGLDALTTGLNETLEGAQQMGHHWLIFPGLDEEDHVSARYDQVADQLNAAGEAAAKVGIRVGYHTHDVDFHPFADGTIPLERLMARLDRRHTDIELDLYWCVKGGSEPRTWFERHPGRFPLVHVKDAGPAPDFVMSDVGAGAMDWRAIFALRRRAGIRHYYVEHDQPADPWASITASYRYLSTLQL
jgi:sugar phosphate isomerase/epimerase